MSVEVSVGLLLHFQFLDGKDKNKLDYTALPCKEKMSQSQKIYFSGMKVTLPEFSATRQLVSSKEQRFNPHTVGVLVFFNG